MKINCLFDELLPIHRLKPFPDNPNSHSDEQIERLAKILKYQGWRYPIKISKQNGFISSGHGRLLAAKLNGWNEVPVNYQDYEDEDQFYADVAADNAIASWAILDFAKINLQVPHFDPSFDIELLGIRDFTLDPSEKINANKEWQGMPEFTQEDKLGFKTIYVHFADQDSVDAFAKLIDQNISAKTKFVWYPKAEIEKVADKRYSSES